MNSMVNLKELEKKAFTTVFEDGLWDIFIGIMLFCFMVAPLLLNDWGFGDFWSVVIFLPVVLVFLWSIKISENRITAPRLGIVKMGENRRKKVFGLQIILVFTVVLGVIIGLVVFLLGDKLYSINWFFPATTCFVFMFSFTAAAVALNVRRYQWYGIMITVLVPMGEILFWKGLIKHHGIPLVFGIVALIILGTGICKFLLFLKHFQLPTEESDGKY